MASTHHFRQPAPPDDGRLGEDARIYWIARAAAELRMAQRTPDSRAKLVHYELSGLCSIKARLASPDECEPMLRSILHVGEADLSAPMRVDGSRTERRAEQPGNVILEEVDTIVLVEPPRLMAFATTIDPAASIITIQT